MSTRRAKDPILAQFGAAASAASPNGVSVGVGGVEAGEQGVEAVFESAGAAGAAEVWGQGHDRGDLFGGQRSEFEGVDFAHLVEADGVGVEGEEGVGGGGGWEAGLQQQLQDSFDDGQAVGAEADPRAVDPG